MNEDLPIIGTTTTLQSPELEGEWLELVISEINQLLDAIRLKLALAGCETATIQFSGLTSEIFALATRLGFDPKDIK